MSARTFTNDGGPLIALDAGDAALWQGGENPDDDSDYGRACKTGYPAGLVPLNATVGVVVGAAEGVGTASWLHSPDGQLFLVGCVFADDNIDDKLQRLLSDEHATWIPLGRTAVPSGKVLLFHAACRLSDPAIDPDRDVAVIGDALSVVVPTGDYTIEAREVIMPDIALFNVVRWTRVRM